MCAFIFNFRWSLNNSFFWPILIESTVTDEITAILNQATVLGISDWFSCQYERLTKIIRGTQCLTLFQCFWLGCCYHDSSCVIVTAVSILSFHHYIFDPEAKRYSSVLIRLATVWICLWITVSKSAIAWGWCCFEILHWLTNTIACSVSCRECICTPLGTLWVKNCLTGFIVWTLCWAQMLNLLRSLVVSEWCTCGKSVCICFTSSFPCAWSFTTWQWVTIFPSHIWIGCVAPKCWNCITTWWVSAKVVIAEDCMRCWKSIRMWWLSTPSLTGVTTLCFRLASSISTISETFHCFITKALFLRSCWALWPGQCSLGSKNSTSLKCWWWFDSVSYLVAIGWWCWRLSAPRFKEITSISTMGEVHTVWQVEAGLVTLIESCFAKSIKNEFIGGAVAICFGNRRSCWSPLTTNLLLYCIWT